MDYARAVLNGNVHGFAVEMRELNLEFQCQQIPPFHQKVILQYNVYVIFCFLHLLLKYDCVGVYSRFKNLFKTFFYFKLCELLVIVSSQSKNFLVVLDTMHRRMIPKNTADFIITVTWQSIKTREKDRNVMDTFVSMAFLSFSHKVEQE